MSSRDDRYEDAGNPNDHHTADDEAKAFATTRSARATPRPTMPGQVVLCASPVAATRPCVAGMCHVFIAISLPPLSSGARRGRRTGFRRALTRRLGSRAHESIRTGTQIVRVGTQISACGLCEAVAMGERGGHGPGGPSMGADLRVGVRDVPLHGSHREEQVAGDL